MDFRGSAAFSHVGLPKTGTTFLETRLLAAMQYLAHVNTNIPDVLFSHRGQVSALLISNKKSGLAMSKHRASSRLHYRADMDTVLEYAARTRDGSVADELSTVV